MSAENSQPEPLSETRTFAFKPSELKGYNQAKPKSMPLRIWVRATLNAAAQLPPPEENLVKIL